METSWMLPAWLWDQDIIWGQGRVFNGVGNSISKDLFKYMVQRKVDLSDSQDPIVLALDSHPLRASKRTGFKSLNSLSPSYV